MNVRPSEMSPREFYRTLICSVVPRPIAWVSTVSKDGSHNLAPFSFFNVICATPPLLGFSPGIRKPDEEKSLLAVKDSLRNVQETGEFVVNVVTFALAEPMNVTSGEYAADVNEFELAHLTTRPSAVVAPPQVAESPVSFECKVFEILSFGSEKAGGSLVIGEIVSIHLEEAILRDGRIDGNLLDAIGRMGGTQYARTSERFELPRPGQKPKRT